MIAGARGACGSLVSLSSSGETGRNPTLAFASCTANIHTASPNTNHLLKRNIAISPQINAGSTEVGTNKICCRRASQNPRGGEAAFAGQLKRPAPKIPGHLVTKNRDPSMTPGKT